MVLLSAYCCSGQNYDCLQAGVKRYFTNDYGYLRGMRIDSVVTSGSDEIYHPFHSDRGDYLVSTLPYSLDSNGGSWLGKQVIKQPDGRFLFDNLWHDTVVIKTQAHTGDSWVFFDDTTTRYYTATITTEDTMTVLSGIDSIKKIVINAYTPSGIDVTDPVNNFQIFLSKDHGFVRIFDLYTFPYHRANVKYAPGIDYYLDQVTENYPPDAANATFSLINLANVPFDQLFDWNPGDVFEFSTLERDIASEGDHPYLYYFDSITKKTVISNGTQFEYSGWIAREHPPFFSAVYDTGHVSANFTISNDLIIDTTIMPEDNHVNYTEVYEVPSSIIYYYPSDIQNCLQSPSYKFIKSEILQHRCIPMSSESTRIITKYKTGIGLTRYNWAFYGSPMKFDDTTLLYYRKSGHECGQYFNSFVVYNTGINSVDCINSAIYPNPVSDKLTITAQTNIDKIIIFNTIGQQVYSKEHNGNSLNINVAQLPAGLYFIQINNTQFGKFIKD
ncbi:MAG: hypothetical protein JWQ38_3681 [Flavipsychrobacter sp.]|nr:hypothetical protein [Flavipsychrobacter sp.]